MSQSKQKQFDKIKDQLGKLRASIDLQYKEEANLLIELADLEKELYPEETQKKIDAVLICLRHRRQLV